MTSIANAISALLYTHDTVIVPGLGAFLCHAEGAKVNVITNQFEKPSASLSFDSLQREENDLVVNYLVANDGITVEEARQLVMTFVSDIFSKLKAGEQAVVDGVGTLSYDENHEMLFNAVEVNDFNVDAFGLEDFNPQPVYGIRRETLDAEQKPLDPDQELPDLKQEPQSYTRRRRTWWIWVLLLLLILAAAGGVAWWYFQSQPIVSKPWPKRSLTSPRPLPTMERPFDIARIDLERHTDTVLEVIPETTSEITPEVTPEITPEITPEVTPEITTEVTPEVTPEITPEEPPTPKERPVEVIVPDASSKAFIVGGCFAVEKNALKMTTEAREQGCADAFVMKRGSKFFVCYGQYPSTADAKAALPQVLSNYNAKAWILKK